MTRMLGCYDLRKREIRVASWILEGPEVPDALRCEVFCHEAAHAVVHQRHGRVSRPHGVEWRALMEQAGFAARVRIPGVVPPPAVHRNRKAWEHRCPVCDRARILRSRQRRLRCRRCVESGRSGALVITRH